MHRWGLTALLTAGMSTAPCLAHAEGEPPGKAAVEAQAPAGVQEIGARVGLAAGGRVTPGGLHLSGLYLYQLSEQDWFEGAVGFSFGSGEAACFRDREDQFLCDHGLVDGFSGSASAGVRRWLASQKRFTPYARAGLAIGLTSFSGDEVRGLVVPAWVGGGVRARVAEGVAVAGEAMLQAGLGWYNRDLGAEPLAALLLVVGVDFRLD